MKPLIVLLAVFAVSVVAIALVQHEYHYAFAARIAMCCMLLFTAMGHFMFTKGMVMMVPEGIPFKREIVYATGVLEIVLGIGLLVQFTMLFAAWTLIAFFVVMLPANINAAVKHIDYQKATTSGSGLSYLWFRVPLQILFIAWTYFSAIGN